jgi:hypothetical protein
MTSPQSSAAHLEGANDELEQEIPHRDEVYRFNQKGLFIGGAAKSGTTLLVSLLDNHPQLVVVPEETGYLEHRSKYRALRNEFARVEFLLNQSGLAGLSRGGMEPESTVPGADVRDYRQFNHQRFHFLARTFARQPWINDSLVFTETIRAYGITLGADWRNCVRWVEKTPRTETCREAMDELFPEARLVQVVRDPRAVFASFKRRYMASRGYHTKAHRLPRSWNRSAREIPRLRRDPSRFLVIRYEDLVSHPRKVLETLCHFGGFDFCEKMLAPTRAGGGWGGNSAFHGFFNGISAAPANQWKGYLTPHEIWWIELHCRRGMELAGYELQTNARFSLGRWLKRLPGESWFGYVRARRASLCQWLGLLKDCRYDQ